MVFRCYSCGLHFSDGPPPLEALSPQQAEIVGAPYQGDPMNILCESLSDLSVYNFCSVCIRFASYEHVWVEDRSHELVHGVRTRRLDETDPHCSCGHKYTVPAQWKKGRDRWIWINRAKRLHMFQVHYPGIQLEVDLDAQV